MTAADRAKQALKAGIFSIPYAARVKGPTTKGWPDLRYESDVEIDAGFPEGCNTGFILGKSSGGLVDVDLDCPEAVALADALLPATAMMWGKASTPRAHRGYRCELTSEQFKDPATPEGAKAMLVEIRSTGGQTMAPGSTHPNGEAVDYAPGCGPEPALIDPEDLRRAVSDLAVACLLVRHYPIKDLRHEAWLAFAGMWLAAGENVEDGEELASGIAQAAGDEEPEDRAGCFATTKERLDSGETATGCTRLGEIIGEPVAKALRKWTGKIEGGTEIRVGVDIYRMADQAEQALAKTGVIFQNVRRLVRIGHNAAPRFLRAEGTPLISPVGAATLQERLSACAQWVRSSKDDVERCKPPRDVTEALMARGEWATIPHLFAISETPLVLPDGRILFTNGYDAETGIFVALEGLEGLWIPEHPTHADAEGAGDRIYEVFQDFPFKEECNFAAALAALLTAFARFAYVGPCPLTLIDSNVRGSGKGLLADVVSTITTGRPASRMANTIDDDEMAKRLLSLALGGASSVLIDNVDGRLGTPALDMAMTSQTLTGRILGVSQMVTVPLICQFFATGNNVQLHGDTCRRTLHVRLESELEKPEERGDFVHPDLLTWVREHRTDLVEDCLTILRAYALAGRPKSSAPPWGSFAGWQDAVCGAVAWLGCAPAEESRKGLLESDTEALGLSALLTGLEALGEMESSEVLAAVEERADGKFATAYKHPALRAAILEMCPGKGPGGLPDAAKLGYTLRRFRGRVVGGAKLESYKVDGRRSWKVVQTGKKL